MSVGCNTTTSQELDAFEARLAILGASAFGCAVVRAYGIAITVFEARPKAKIAMTTDHQVVTNHNFLLYRAISKFIPKIENFQVVASSYVSPPLC